MLWQRNTLNNEIGYLSHENLLSDIGRYWNFFLGILLLRPRSQLSESHDHLVVTLVTLICSSQRREKSGFRLAVKHISISFVLSFSYFGFS